MSIRIIPKSQQGQGAFNGGEIIENKPIGFPQDHSSIRPYSSLFYWAHARGVTDSTIGLHPHQGFEICSFVLKGKIRHYDTKLQEWRPLQSGDVQIIRAGNGISHSEWLAKDSEIFQIWFDPDLSRTLDKPATYDDYKSAEFPVTLDNGVRIRTLAGAGSPFAMDTPGVEVKQIEIVRSVYPITADAEKVYSLYVLEGTCTINDETAQTSDFIIATSAEQIELKTSSSATVFMIVSQANPGYKTYAQMRGMG